MAALARIGGIRMTRRWHSLALGAMAAMCADAGAADAWVSYGESELGIHYFDPTSIRTDGQRRRVWRLIDRKQKLPGGIHSGKALIEIDCTGGSYRYVQTLQYSGRMGGGKYLQGEGEQPPGPISPGTMVAHLAQLVC
jgi:hypothetical protein